MGAELLEVVGNGKVTAVRYTEPTGAVREIDTDFVFGLVVFGDVPSWPTIIGVSIIIGAGIYIFLRERELGREDVTVSPPA